MITKIFIRLIVFCCLFYIFLISCREEIPIEIIPDFSLETEYEDYTVPATVEIRNYSSGADWFRWVFEGGNPAWSDRKQPGKVVYSQAGTYTVWLEAGNDYHRECKALEIVLDSLAVLDFDPQVQVNAFVPATLKIVNRTRGCDSCEWTFEGGVPSLAQGYQPPPVHYTRPGEYRINLRVVSGRKTHELSKTVTLLPELNSDFEIVPDRGDEDMEIPWRAMLKNKSVSGLTYRWKAPGGILEGDVEENTSVFYDQPGTYTIELVAENGKQTKMKTAIVQLFPNTNLIVAEDVRLGINTSKIVGCFYSCLEKRAFPETEIDDKNGPGIDFVFFGLNPDFSYYRFLSPDEVQNFVFEAIPGAGKTWFADPVGQAKILFDEKDFREMKDDSILQGLPIRENSSAGIYFQSGPSSRIVLFETSDGRKGAIWIKQWTAAGSESFIMVDIKVQKEKR